MGFPNDIIPQVSNSGSGGWYREEECGDVARRSKVVGMQRPRYRF